jgi:DNA polymerase III subunit delta
MRVGPDDLPRRLETRLPPAILLFGEEPLLIEESVRRVRRSALDQGFTDRIPLSAETGFDWGRLTGSSQSLSLFSERRLIELRLPTGKPGEAGTQALAALCEAADQDVCLLAITGRLDGRTKQAKWVKVLDSAGWTVEHKALDAGRFNGWIQKRLRDRELTLDRDTIERLCHLMEGNLLAVAQEIDRIALFADENGYVDPETVTRGLADHARFSAYTAIDACLEGNARKALRILRVLRNGGTEPAIMSWSFAKDLRSLVRIEHGLRTGGQKGRLFKSNQIWSTRTPLFNAALSRLGERQLRALMRQMARCDRVLKGREDGDIWPELDALALMMCDIRHAVEDRAVSHAAG